MWDEYDEREDRVATESEAHAEWHRNAGVPMGTPGCPWDACHPDYEPGYEEFTVRITLGNDAMRSPEDIARELRRVADRVEGGADGGVVRDANGNTVGEFNLK